MKITKVCVEGSFADKLFLKEDFAELGYIWIDMPKDAKVCYGAAEFLRCQSEKDRPLVLEACADHIDIRVGTERYQCVPCFSTFPLLQVRNIPLSKESGTLQMELILTSIDGKEKILGGFTVPTAGYTEDHVAQVHVEMMANRNLECVVSVVDRNGID